MNYISQFCIFIYLSAFIISILIFLSQCISFRPTTNAIMGLTFASYVLQPFYEGGCEVPTAAKQMLAAITICFLTYLNSFYMKVTTKMQNIIMFTKIAALVLIIVIGLVWMFMGKLKQYLKH